MREILSVALIQPTFDPEKAWGPINGPYSLNMNKVVAERIWSQIKIGIKNALRDRSKPNIILIPELHLGHSYVSNLKNIAIKHGVLIIAGLDFKKDPTSDKHIENVAQIIIPNKWPKRNHNSNAKVVKFGKTNFTYMEKNRFNNQLEEPNNCFESPEPNMYILSSKDFGNIGLMICSDFFDIERYLIYQGKIHHLFVIALNKDLNSYFHLAESLTRLLYSNIVVCNSGVFGGSVVHSPYSNPNKRTIYKREGQDLFAYQVIKLPVKSLDTAQNFDFTKDKNKAGIQFKAHPPGYKKSSLKPL